MPQEIETLRDLVHRSYTKFPSLLAFQIKKNGDYRKYSFGKAYELISALSSYLLANGIKKGDRVAILSENRPEWGIAYFSIVSIGAIAVPLDALLTKEEIGMLLSDSGAKLVLISDNLQKKHQFSLKSFSLEEIETLELKFRPEAKVVPEDLASIVYTSGTTGNPKGIMLTHRNLISNVTAVAKLFGITPSDNFLSVLPLHHTFESTAGFLCPFYIGAAITYAESLKSYSLVKNMKETGVSIMCGVPLLYNLFLEGIYREVGEKGFLAQGIFNSLKLASRSFPSEFVRRKIFGMIHKKLGGKIKFFVSGGAAIDPEIIKGFSLLGIKIIQGYGLTESSPILACCTEKDNRIGSVGKPLPNVEIRITEVGEILAFGPNIMKGYYQRPDLTQEVLKDGWLQTGDVGCFDQEGFLYITGRIKDIIVSGSGVNVYPEEVEFFLKRIKGIKETCVFGLKVKEGIKKGMEEVLAVIVPDYDYFMRKKKMPEQQEIEQAIRQEIKKLNLSLPEHKRISEIRFRSIELPKTTTKKIKRFEIKKEMGI